MAVILMIYTWINTQCSWFYPLWGDLCEAFMEIMLMHKWLVEWLQQLLCDEALFLYLFHLDQTVAFYMACWNTPVDVYAIKGWVWAHKLSFRWNRNTKDVQAGAIKVQMIIKVQMNNNNNNNNVTKLAGQPLNIIQLKSYQQMYTIRCRPSNHSENRINWY